MSRATAAAAISKSPPAASLSSSRRRTEDFRSGLEVCIIHPKSRMAARCRNTLSVGRIAPPHLFGGYTSAKPVSLARRPHPRPGARLQPSRDSSGSGQHRELYHGSPSAVRFRLAVIGVDLLLVAFSVRAPMMRRCRSSLPSTTSSPSAPFNDLAKAAGRVRHVGANMLKRALRSDTLAMVSQVVAIADRS